MADTARPPADCWADVTRIGRLTYRVELHFEHTAANGLLAGVSWSWTCLGPRWAAWKARRVLAWAARHRAWREDVTRIEPPALYKSPITKEQP